MGQVLLQVSVKVGGQAPAAAISPRGNFCLDSWAGRGLNLVPLHLQLVTASPREQDLTPQDKQEHLLYWWVLLAYRALSWPLSLSSYVSGALLKCSIINIQWSLKILRVQLNELYKCIHLVLITHMEISNELCNSVTYRLLLVLPASVTMYFTSVFLFLL